MKVIYSVAHVLELNAISAKVWAPVQMKLNTSHLIGSARVCLETDSRQVAVYAASLGE